MFSKRNLNFKVTEGDGGMNGRELKETTDEMPAESMQFNRRSSHWRPRGGDTKDRNPQLMGDVPSEPHFSL